MGFRIRRLHPDDPPESFPEAADAGTALGYPEGLIAVGGDLSPPRLIEAYSRGIFPWFNDDQPILWWSPNPRAVIYPERFHMSRSLARLIRSGTWQYSLNQAFDEVIHECAENRGEHGTWITDDMQEAYTTMHRMGYAHSVESWRDGELAGGIYGVRLGNAFFGESMFSRTTGGSKVAISGLIKLCLNNGIELLDCQLPSEHLRSLGMVEITRSDFLEYLKTGVQNHQAITDWGFPPRDAAELTSLRANQAEQNFLD